MKRFQIGVIFVAAFSIDCGSCIFAGPLANHPQAFNDGNGPAGGAWTGISPYSDEFSNGRLEGTIEWAVFGPGQFPYAGLNGWTPLPGQLTYAYQILNTGSNGIANMSFQGALTGVNNAGATVLGAANETPPLFVFNDSGDVGYGFAYYDDEQEQTVGTPVPAFTGISAGLVLSSTRVPIRGPGNVVSYGGVLHLTIRPFIAIPDGSLYVPPASDADYNNNGTVDAADFVLWRDGALAADGTGPGGTPDGVVNGLDYSFWRAAFGEPAGAGSSADNLAVPEPSTVSLLLMLLLGTPAACRIRKPRR